MPMPSPGAGPIASASSPMAPSRKHMPSAPYAPPGVCYSVLIISVCMHVRVGLDVQVHMCHKMSGQHAF